MIQVRINCSNAVRQPLETSVSNVQVKSLTTNINNADGEGHRIQDRHRQRKLMRKASTQILLTAVLLVAVISDSHAESGESGNNATVTPTGGASDALPPEPGTTSETLPPEPGTVSDAKTNAAGEQAKLPPPNASKPKWRQNGKRKKHRRKKQGRSTYQRILGKIYWREVRCQ